MTEIMYIAYHDSKPIYAECGKQLARSLEKTGTKPYFIEKVPGTSWSFGQACAYKPGFIAKCMTMFPDHDRFVYLDSDSVVTSYPGYFEQIPHNCDVAAHFRGGKELLSGTLYFRRSIVVIDILMEWSRRCYDDLRTWEQRHLQRLLEGNDLIRVHHLPPEYCQIFDLMAGHGGEPVIKQMQASRLSRGIDKGHSPICNL